MIIFFPKIRKNVFPNKEENRNKKSQINDFEIMSFDQQKKTTSIIINFNFLFYFFFPTISLKETNKVIKRLNVFELFLIIL